ncbi:MAG: SDR family NAD(P)-dependent oxidoreductase, partial [Gammaproteobacteria bacterium]
MNFAGKVVLVTGASRGIGRAIAQAFAAEGAAVVVNYLSNDAAADEVVAQCQAAGGDAWASKADVGSEAAVQKLVEQTLDEMGRIDVLVNNAFRSYSFDPEQRRSFGELAWADYQSQFDGAVGAAYNTCKAVLPHFRRRAQGAI